DLERVGGEAVTALEMLEREENELGIFLRVLRMRKRALQRASEVDVVEVDVELLAIGLDRLRERKNELLHLVVEDGELESRGIGDVRVAVVIDLFVVMPAVFPVADFSMAEETPG